MARRAQRINTRVRAAGVDEDLLVLLEPRVERVPVEANGPNYAALGVEPGRARPRDLADPQSLQLSGPTMRVLRMLLVDEERSVHVRDRDVVLRVVGRIPYIERLRSVEPHFPSQWRPNPGGH